MSKPSSSFDYALRSLVPDEQVSRYASSTNKCARRGCKRNAAFVASYKYVTGKRGRVTTREQGLCADHAADFARKHNVPGVLYQARLFEAVCAQLRAAHPGATATLEQSAQSAGDGMILLPLDGLSTALEAAGVKLAQSPDGRVGHGGPCGCGAPLPWHLFEIADDDPRFSHVCSCGRTWRPRGGRAVFVGMSEPLREPQVQA